MQLSTEPTVTNSSVPSDFLVEGQDSGLGTTHPFLTLNVFRTLFFPLEKRKTLSSVMDGHQKRRERVLFVVLLTAVVELA